MCYPITLMLILTRGLLCAWQRSDAFSLEWIGKDPLKTLDNRTTLRAFIISSPRHRRAGERHLPPDGIGNLSIPETAPVGRGHVPAECRNYQVRTNLFMPAACRFAVGGDMSPPYRGCFVYHGTFCRLHHAAPQKSTPPHTRRYATAFFYLILKTD